MSVMYTSQASIQDFEERGMTPVTFTRLCPSASTRYVNNYDMLNALLMIIDQVYEGSHYFPRDPQAGEGSQGGGAARAELC